MNNIGFHIYDGFVPTHTLDIGGWNGNSNLFKMLVSNTKPKTIIEVGTWKGQSAINMAKECKKLPHKTTIYCVDTWLGASEFWSDNHGNERDLMLKNGYPTIYYQFLSNVVHSDVQDIIVPFPQPSHLASKWFSRKGIKADMIYIDGSHEYEDVFQDLTDYYPILEKGGVIFGDDYNQAWTSVIRAVNDYARLHNVYVEIFDNNFWIIRSP